jgi:UDP-N-acetylglucosamine--N-acetylmuramyl-(pentapeptide) pyrophosphoryl-undecaprenol N-acetylglucosamine transferase
MKIVFTGGGTGGHFYPLIAIAESMRIQAEKDHLDTLKLYYYSDVPYDNESLSTLSIRFEAIPSGKLGLSYSLFQKIASFLTAGRGVLVALWKLFWLYPDAVVSKGGYASVPTSIAAWILRIPLFVHESDSAAGRTTILLSRFAKTVFISYSSAASYFPKAKEIIHTGHPVRRALLHAAPEGARELLGLEVNLPVLWIVGGSSGAQKINNVILGMLPDILHHFQVVHQTGKNNYESVISESSVVLEGQPNKERYHPFPYMDELTQRRIAGVASIVITRAGSALFEFAAWGIPALVVPFAVSNNDHSRKNAYSYAASGACTIVEEANLSPEIIRTELLHILSDPALRKDMSEKAKTFATPGAADHIAYVVMQTGYEHTPLPKEPELPLSVLIEEQLGIQEGKLEK